MYVIICSVERRPVDSDDSHKLPEGQQLPQPHRQVEQTLTRSSKYSSEINPKKSAQSPTSLMHKAFKVLPHSGILCCLRHEQLHFCIVFQTSEP